MDVLKEPQIVRFSEQSVNGVNALSRIAALRPASGAPRRTHHAARIDPAVHVGGWTDSATLSHPGAGPVEGGMLGDASTTRVGSLSRTSQSQWTEGHDRIRDQAA